MADGNLTPEDPRRELPIKIVWQDDNANRIARLTIGGETWAFVEWSEKRQEWCIEDSQGECLRHAQNLRGTSETALGAIDLAEAMIRDGRMPSPEDARAQRQAAPQGQNHGHYQHRHATDRGHCDRG
jgi:hypothetical protein